MDRVKQILCEENFEATCETHIDYKDSPIVQAINRLVSGMGFAAQEFEHTRPWFDGLEHINSRQALTQMIQVVDLTVPSDKLSSQCPICFTKYVTLEVSVGIETGWWGGWWKTPDVAVALKCGHIHCGSCTFRWFIEDYKRTCPTCREPVHVSTGFQMRRPGKELALEWQAHLVSARCCTVWLNSSYRVVADDQGHPLLWTVDKLLDNINISKENRKEVARDSRWIELIATVIFGLIAFAGEDLHLQSYQWRRARRLLYGLKGHLESIYMPGKWRNRLLFELRILMRKRSIEKEEDEDKRGAHSARLTDMIYRMVVLFETTKASSQPLAGSRSRSRSMSTNHIKSGLTRLASMKRSKGQ